MRGKIVGIKQRDVVLRDEWVGKNWICARRGRIVQCESLLEKPVKLFGNGCKKYCWRKLYH